MATPESPATFFSLCNLGIIIAILFGHWAWTLILIEKHRDNDSVSAVMIWERAEIETFRDDVWHQLCGLSNYICLADVLIRPDQGYYQVLSSNIKNKSHQIILPINFEIFFLPIWDIFWAWCLNFMTLWSFTTLELQQSI